MNVRGRGFSLLELLVVLCLAAMLTVLATSSYAHVMARAHRHEVRLALWRWAGAQEQHQLRFGRYADQTASGPGAMESAAVLPLGASAPEGWHFAFEAVTDEGWALVATPSAPLRDSECAAWRLDHTGLATAHAVDGRDTTTACWRR